MAKGFLKGRVALVLGASGDIGGVIAARLAEQEADIAIAGRNGEVLETLAAGISQLHGGRVACCAGDLRDPSVPERLVAEAVAALGRLDILVCSAGEFKRGDLLSVSAEDWTNGFGAMFFGAIGVVKAAWPHLKAAHGHLVTISGVFARRPIKGAAIPGALAAALHNFTMSTAELGLQDGVSVNGILPGPIMGRRGNAHLERFAREQGLEGEAAQAAYASHIGAKRLGTPEDVAAAVAYLVSEEASFLHGASLVLDGGITRIV